VIAVSTVDAVGGTLIAIGAALWLIVDGVRDRVRAGSSPQSRTNTRQAPAPARAVEPGTFSAADSTHREGVAVPLHRRPSAAEAIEALTFPGPYSRIGNRR
jgi:hypothetical protein